MRLQGLRRFRRKSKKGVGSLFNYTRRSPLGLFHGSPTLYLAWQGPSKLCQGSWQCCRINGNVQPGCRHLSLELGFSADLPCQKLSRLFQKPLANLIDLIGHFMSPCSHFIRGFVYSNSLLFLNSTESPPIGTCPWLTLIHDIAIHRSIQYVQYVR